MPHAIVRTTASAEQLGLCGCSRRDAHGVRTQLPPPPGDWYAGKEGKRPHRTRDRFGFIDRNTEVGSVDGFMPRRMCVPSTAKTDFQVCVCVVRVDHVPSSQRPVQAQRSEHQPEQADRERVSRASLQGRCARDAPVGHVLGGRNVFLREPSDQLWQGRKSHVNSKTLFM